MTDQTPGEAAAAAAANADDKPSKASKAKAAAVKLPDGSPKLDFLSAAEAEAQADAIGGTVVHSGVAFHVEPKS